ncbi:hypothetical protein [Mycolicibacterium thermoresistibile]
MTNSAARPPRGRRDIALACWCGAIGGFQVALAVGVPWGAAAWGGRHAGVLPPRLRLASAAAAPVVAGVGAVAAGHLLGDRGRRRVLLGTAVYAGLGIVANSVSPSTAERLVWGPMSAVGAVLAVRAWREAASGPGER